MASDLEVGQGKNVTGSYPAHDRKKAEDPMAEAYGYVPITKQEKTADGTLIVSGPATDSSVDRDFQIADPKWLDKAMPAWFSEGGNIREQHDGKRAAGVAVTYQKRDDGQHWIDAEIVDPVTITKIQKNVLRGFSFGAKNARVTVDKAAAGGRIVDGTITEVSVVDRPCNPGMLFTIAKADSSGDLQPVEDPELVETEKADDEKRYTPTQFAEILKSLGKTPGAVEKKDFTQGERDAAAKSGAAMKDGSFPIQNAAQLKDAIGLVGNAKDPKAAKAHVVSRARTLGLVDKLPDSWGISKADTVLSDMRRLVPGAITKAADAAAFDPATEASDVDAGTSAIACIARLIISEAEGLAAGRMEELNDIQILTQAALALSCFVMNETDQEVRLMSETDKADEATTGTGTEPADTTKTDAATTAAETKTEAVETDELTKTAKTDTTDDITKALGALEERLTKAFDAQMAKVLETPVAGGPVRTRTTTQKAVTAKADGLRAEIARCEDAINTTGGELQKGYRERLVTAEAELTKLDGAA